MYIIVKQTTVATKKFMSKTDVYVKITTVNNIYTLPATILQTLVTIAYKSVSDHLVYIDKRHYQTFSTLPLESCF